MALFELEYEVHVGTLSKKCRFTTTGSNEEDARDRLLNAWKFSNMTDRTPTQDLKSLFEIDDIISDEEIYTTWCEEMQEGRKKDEFVKRKFNTMSGVIQNGIIKRCSSSVIFSFDN
jgi:hypothetical protein